LLFTLAMQALSAALDVWRIALLPDPALYESAAQAVIAKPAAAIKAIRLPPIARPVGGKLARGVGGERILLSINRPARQPRGGESK
jgi:hypothetical protein